MELMEPANPRYALEIRRLRSFDTWPRGLAQKPQEMAAAGFFYTGEGDRVRCYYCDGGVKDWEAEDVPLKVHKQYFNRCPYIMLLEDEDKSIGETAQKTNVKSRNCVITSKNCEVSIQNDIDNVKYYKDMSCKICTVEEVSTVLIPCGHVITCTKCTLSVNNTCPMCRKPFYIVVKIYF